MSLHGATTESLRNEDEEKWMNIRVEGNGVEYLAVYEGDPAIRATGSSPDEAVGALIRLHPIELGLTVILDEKPYGKPSMSQYL